MIFLQTMSYNVDVAKVFGTCSSIFLSCLDFEFEHQKRANQLNANNTVALSRAEIYSRTGLDDEKQIDIELALTECGVISAKPFQNVANKNYYILYADQLKRIMEAENPEEAIANGEAKQFIKTPRVEPRSKRQTHIAKLKKKISASNPVVAQYMCDWIDAVYTNPKGFLSPSGVDINQKELQAYTKNDDVQIEILKLAIKGGCRELSWAIDRYEEQNKSKVTNSFVKYSDIKSNGADIVEEEF